jgi:8-oxo-dGTP pyrophosphatase MutT (NUDIX family)
MKKVAKLVIVDKDNNYLLLNLNNHPAFGNDPDLPGGTADGDESPLEAMIREVQEEIGVRIGKDRVEEVYSGTDYSTHGTQYTLFAAQVDERPLITLSWEHTSYEWVSFDSFLKSAQRARDTFMHMAHDIVQNLKK